jgi:hypothetical protein
MHILLVESGAEIRGADVRDSWLGVDLLIMNSQGFAIMNSHGFAISKRVMQEHRNCVGGWAQIPTGDMLVSIAFIRCVSCQLPHVFFNSR